MTINPREPDRRRRQLKRAGSVRGVRHVVRVNAEQEARLQARADERGITVARLLVESALAGGADAAATKAATMADLFLVVRLLGQVGNNVNQLARVANATGALPPEAPAALASLTRATDRLTVFMAEVDAR